MVINMNYTYHYEFHPHGVTVSKEDHEPSHVWVDNGNALDYGLFDHHQNDTFRCTVEAIYCNQNLLASITPAKDQSITFHTHREPDTDSLFAIYLIQNYLENKESASAFPSTIEQILDYVKAVDTGHIRLAENPDQPLVSLYCILTFVFQLQKDPIKAMQKALAVIHQAVTQSEEATADMPFDFFYSPVHAENCKRELALANKDYQQYLQDKQTICTKAKFNVPLANEAISTEKLDTMIWNAQPTCSFNRILARMDGYPLTIVPFSPIPDTNPKSGLSYTNVIISLNPSCNENREQAYSLLPIARFLEFYEQEKENILLKERGVYRRNHSEPRGYRDTENSISLTPPFMETSDPWFVNADHTLIAAPHSGSLLSLNEIIDVITSFSECRMKDFENKVVVPFHFDLEKQDDILKILQKQEVADKQEVVFPYLQSDKNYFNPMLQEYVSGKDNFSYFRIPVNAAIMQRFTEINPTYHYAEDMEIIIFPYGIGFFVLSASAELTGEAVSTFSGIVHLLTFRSKLEDHFKGGLSVSDNSLTRIFPDDLVSTMNPHFFTLVNLSPENSKLTNNTVIRYASMLCSSIGTLAYDSKTVSVNYRQHMAFSGLGCAFISTDYSCDTLFDRLSQKEWFFLYLLVLEQRYVLLECKRQLVEVGLNEKRRIKALQEMLIEFSSNGYFTSAMNNEVSDSVYRQMLEEVFRVSALKEQIQNQLEQLSSYHESKVTAALDKISVWILPFMIISTILQCSLITMEPLVGVSRKGFPFTLTDNVQAFLSWGIMLLCVLFLFVILRLTNRHRK